LTEHDEYELIQMNW